MLQTLDRKVQFGRGYGHSIDHPMTAEEAIRLAHQDWDVAKVQLHLPSGQPVQGQYAVVRTDTGRPLGVVGERYRTFSNRSVFFFMDSITNTNGLTYESAGSVRGGRIVYLLARLPESMSVLPGDTVNRYLLVATSHDGTLGISVTLTPIRVTCDNALIAAFSRGTNTYRIKHTDHAHSSEAVAKARQIIGLADSYFGTIQEAYQAMASTPLSVAQTRAYLEKCLAMESAPEEQSTRSRNILESVMGLIESGRGSNIPGVRGTVWGSYNSLTEHVDHFKKYRNDDLRTESRLFAGHGQAMKQRAFDLALQLIK